MSAAVSDFVDAVGIEGVEKLLREYRSEASAALQAATTSGVEMVEDDDVSMDGDDYAGPSDVPVEHDDPYGRIPVKGKPGRFSMGVQTGGVRGAGVVHGV